MISHHIFYQMVLLGLLWLFIMLHVIWPSDQPAPAPKLPQPVPPSRTRSKEPKPFVGLPRQPHCDACAQASEAPTLSPSPVLPPTITSTRGRRHIDTSHHFCPHPGCAYGGWLGLGNLSANGHPNGGPWRQLYCSHCGGYFLETHGTIFHGKRVSVDLIVHVIGCLAEGLGIRSTARVFEVDPNTVLQWLVEAADQLRAFSHYFYTTYTSRRCNWTNSMRYSVPSRLVRFAKAKQSSAWSARPTGSGWRWIPRASCC